MRKIGLFVTACVVLWGCSSLPDHPDKLTYPSLQYTPPDPAAYRVVLKNGTTLFITEDHTVPVVEISAIFRGGSYLDPADKTGLAATVGDVWRTGGTTTRKAEDIDERLDTLAASISTSFDLTSGSASLFVLSKDLNEGLDMFFDVLKNPAFREDKLKLFQAQAVEAMKGRNDRTGEIREREFRRLLYGDHPTTRISTRAGIEAITQADLAAFHRKWVHSRNVTWAIAGDFKKSDMIERLEQALSQWNTTGEIPPRIASPTHVPVPGVTMLHKDKATQGNVVMGHLGLDMHHPDMYAVGLMNYILGAGSFTSRLNKTVRSDEGLAYSIGSSFAPGAWYPGIFSIGYQSKNPSTPYAAQLCLKEVRRLQDGGVTPEELEVAKNYFIDSFPTRFATKYSMVSTFANDEIIGRPKDFYRTYRERIQKVTLQDVQDVARRHLHPDKMVIVVVGDLETIRKGDGVHNVSFDSFGPVTVLPLPDPFTLQRPQQN